jgi:hypothetical protein
VFCEVPVVTSTPDPTPAGRSADPSVLASARPAPPTTEDPARWGRVAEDGTVYVRTADGERAVGQWPDGDPGEALRFFARRYEGLASEVQLLEQRVRAGTVSPEEGTGAVKQLRASVSGANAVGDLAALVGRLDALTVVLGEQREQRRAERVLRLAEAKQQKEQIVARAEALAESHDWRVGADQMRALLEEWKPLPRLEKAVDDALWRRFSTARTTFTRRRKAHYAQLEEQREGARAVKEKLVKEAEALSSSTDWGPTAGAYRELMRRWKEAGPAPKGVDDRLWKRFRAAQDAFFTARDSVNAATDAEYAENAKRKEQLLVEAEALLPVTDLAAAKAAFRSLAEQWDAAGKVPRERMKELEGRIRKVEQAIRGVEEDAWRRSNPEARARAAATVAQLEASIQALEQRRDKAAAAGDDKAASEHTEALEARRSWLEEARKALHEFS